MTRVRIVRASELSQYEYCARAWWLERVLGYESASTEEIAAGQEEHLRHGREVRIARNLQRLAYLLLALAALVGTALLLLITR